MANWQDVKRFICQNYRVSDDQGHGLTLLFDTGSGRSQVLRIVGNDDIPFIALSSRKGSVQEIDANVLMALTNSAGRMMGVRQIGDGYHVVATVLLDDLSDQEIQMPMQWVFEEADAYELELGLGDRE